MAEQTERVWIAPKKRILSLHEADGYLYSDFPDEKTLLEYLFYMTKRGYLIQ